MTSAPAISPFESAFELARQAQPMRVSGRVSGVRGLTVLVDELPIPVGSLVSVGRGGVLGEVVALAPGQAVVMLLGETVGIRAGDEVEGREAVQTAGVGRRLLGRVVDGLVRPIDGRGPIGDVFPRPLNPMPVPALKRRRISLAMHTGTRALDLMTTVGRGQRVGIFAGPGVGKSSLLGAMARSSDADVNVIALIGERGREVREFIEESLGEEGLARSVVVVATGDESPLLRVRAAKVACSVAEYFRDLGQDVLLMMDSITRFAHAQRQVGLSVGEPPATKGYTPSVFAQLALLLERAGAVGGERGGSITGLYTILVEGDDLTEPISDAARGILDGHVVLSRKLAQKGHFPAIDVLDSVSRVMDEVSDAEHVEARRRVVRMLALYREVADLVQIGAYAAGTNVETDVAIEFQERVNALLRQGKGERTPFTEARAAMVELVKAADARMRALSGKPAPARKKA